MRPFAVAGLQMNVNAGSDNVGSASFKIKEMVERFPWIEMVVLSELAVSGMQPHDAQTLPGPAEEAFREVARDLGIWLVPGSIYETCGATIYNTASVIDPHGRVIGRYRKMFPFQPYEPGISAGAAPFVFDIPDVGRFGLSICYDLWFPEHSRWLVSLGAEVILHPSLTDTIDRDIELAIIRATAAQNQCFVIDVNGVGQGGNGRSLFVGPAGDVLHTAGSDEQQIPVELDLDRVSRSREVGLRGLGQPLKSFRDRPFPFACYDNTSPYLDSLGPLSLPTRGSRLGVKTS